LSVNNSLAALYVDSFFRLYRYVQQNSSTHLNVNPEQRNVKRLDGHNGHCDKRI